MKRLLVMLILCVWSSVANAAGFYLLGGGYAHPWDTAVTHGLLTNTPGDYTLATVNYDYWTNGTGKPPGVTTNGPAFYDDVFRLNQGRKILAVFYNVPTNAIASFVPMIVARYPDIWAVGPINENSDYSVIVPTISLFRLALPNTRLFGPNYQNDYAPSYLDALIASNTLAQFDILSMHDYFACPGNGSAIPPPWTTNVYAHPNEVTSHGYPALADRLALLKTYVPNLRTNTFTGPKVMITEYGLYVSNRNDALLAADIFRAQNIPVIMWAGFPANTTNSFPYGNAIYNEDGSAVAWSEAMQAFLNSFLLNRTYIRNVRIGP